jgi:transposase InsO family protein
MTESVEQRFGLMNRLPLPIEWLSDNGSPYTARETLALAREIGLVPCTTPIESPQTTDVIDKDLFRGFRSSCRFFVRQRRAVSPSRPAHVGASRAGVVKTDRRSPPQAAWS